jgi:hypothetical protein
MERKEGKESIVVFLVAVVNVQLLILAQRDPGFVSSDISHFHTERGLCC